MSTGTTNSMSLLTGLLQSPLDPGYAEAAERRAREHPGAPRPERRPSWLAAAGLVLVAAVLAVAAVQTHRQLPSAEKDRARLVAQVQEREKVGTDLQLRAQQLRAEVSQQRRAALRFSSEGQQLATTLATLESAAAGTALTGPGVTVTLADAADSVTSADGDPRTTAGDASRVTDKDLQTVVNGLWAAGAEAIAIGGYRLSTLTTIRSAGEAVLVDFHPLASPYTVVALGPRQPLRGAATDGPAGRYLARLTSDYGITSEVSAGDDLSVPAATLGSTRVASLPPGVTVPNVPTTVGGGQQKGGGRS